MMNEEHSLMTMNAITYAVDSIAYEFKNLAIMKQELVYIESFNPTIKLDGNEWCVLYGDNIQEGICGFGSTPIEAIYAFNKALQTKQEGSI